MNVSRVLLLAFFLLSGCAASSEKLVRSIGGREAENKPEYLSYVLMTKKDSICGGTLISKNLVLTAAHCVYNTNNKTLVDKSIITVAKGPKLGLDYDAELLPENAEGTASVARIIPHPKYTMTAGEADLNDIAILVLNGTLPGPVAKLAKPGASAKVPTGTKMTVVGFGYNNRYPLQPEGKDGFMPYFSPMLYELTLSLGQISKEPCDFPELDNKRQLCLIGEKVSFPFPNENGELETVTGMQSSCHGDSGGPLYYKGVQYGLVSFGRGLCSEFMANPSIFTKISANRKHFIDPIVKKYGA